MVKKSYLLILFIVLNLSAQAHAADPIAMLTDLQGKVELTTSSTQVLTILSELRVGDEISVAAKGRLVLVILESGQEYEIIGPAEIRFNRTSPIGINGNRPKLIGSALTTKETTKIQPLKVTQAAVLMRSVENARSEIKLISPNDTKVIEQIPTFFWQPVAPDLQYKLQLIDETNNRIYETSVNETSATLPDSIKLKEAASYKWRVSTNDPAGKLFSNIGSFTLAPQELKILSNTLRPDDNAEFSKRIVYAVWLEQAELRDEAKKYWKSLSEERADDPFLKVLAEN